MCSGIRLQIIIHWNLKLLTVPFTYWNLVHIRGNANPGELILRIPETSDGDIYGVINNSRTALIFNQLQN